MSTERNIVSFFYAESIPIAHVLFHNLDEFLPSAAEGLK